MAGADDISTLLGMFSGSGENGGESIFGDLDPELLMKLLEMASKLGGDDKNTALLNALRPHLRPENRTKLDRAARLMKIIGVVELLRESGIADELFGGNR